MQIRLWHIHPGAPHVFGKIAVLTIQITAFGGVEIDCRRRQAETQGLHLLIKTFFAIGKGLGQILSQKKGHRLFFGSQSPESAVSFHHRDIVRMADIQKIKTGAGPDIGAGPGCVNC